MPTENRSSNTEQMVSVPRPIGAEPLKGMYYPAECTRCGWIGSSGELTEDDAQCTQMIDADDNHHCLGDTEELDAHRLLEIIQKEFRQPAAQHQGEPVAYWVIDEFGQKKVVLPGSETVARGKARGYAMRPLYFHPPTSDGFSAGDIADQGAKAFAARDPEVEELRTKLAERENQCANLRATINAVRTVFEDNVDVVEYIDALTTGSAEPSAPVERDQGIPATSFQRLNMLANQGE